MNLVRADVYCLPLAANSIDMIFADPPYVAAGFHTYEWLAQEAIRVLKPGCFVAAMCGGLRLNQFMRWFDDAGLSFYWLYQLGMADKASFVWINAGGNVRMPVIAKTKNILVYSKGPSVAKTQTVGLYWPNGADKVFHHWGQDVDSHRYYIDCFSKPGDLVLDPFCGGGTTAVACQILDRRFLCMDIDPVALSTTAARLSGNGRTTRYPLFDLEHA